MYEEEDDIQPLIQYESAFEDESQGLENQTDTQRISADIEFNQVVYGYRKCQWRTILVYIASCLTVGIPFLIFHWLPTWFVYLTCVRCNFHEADRVVVEETYQKKFKSYFIHRIRTNDINDKSGISNVVFEGDSGDVKESIDSLTDKHVTLPLDDGTKITVSKYRFFRHKKQSLIWVGARGAWRVLAGAERGARCHTLHSMAEHLPTADERARMLKVYGLNEIKVQVQSIPTLVLLEVFNPFYVFQLFTICVWLAENYYYYCVAVVIMSLFGVITSVVQTRKNQTSLRATVESSSTVLLSSGLSSPSWAVAPGDVIALGPRPATLLFDAVLLSGGAVVNESMLTGESVPVTKTALLKVDKPFDMKENSSSILFSGTRLIQTKSFNNQPVKALVLRTGYQTSKGQLIRSILYPVPADFKFDRDSYKFIFILAFLAFLGIAYTVALMWSRLRSAGDVVIKSLDILTIVVPPALPAAMTVGRLYAVTRLKEQRVSCLNTRAVNVSGSVDCMCFDKTGTLTEDGLDMFGVVPVQESVTPRTLGATNRSPATLNDLSDLKIGMAACHSLTLLDEKLDGDPLDLKMFESTGWTLEEPSLDENSKCEVFTIVRPKRKGTNINVDDIHLPLEVGIVHQYQFQSSLQRSSVAARVRGEDVLRVYCKGAPETLARRCRAETVPSNLSQVLSEYAEKGYRVIGMSTRMMENTCQELQEMDRDQVEKDLEFLGLVILENRLKPATAAIIRELKEANIHVVMITGDNIHTAVSVALECGLVLPDERIVSMEVAQEGGNRLYAHNWIRGSHSGPGAPLRPPASGLALDSGLGSHSAETPAATPRYKIVMTGDAWQVLRTEYPSLVGTVIERGAVFARMTSEQKQQLIVAYQALGYYVGMCGDGANDCGALKSAHAGVSLSALEAGVAAPFTSTTPDIRCISTLLREGRAALDTSFGVFKFMVGYSLTEFLSVAFLYYFESNLTDFQFLFIDVALIVNFAFFFGMTKAYTGKLCKVPPLTSLLGLVPILSIVGQLSIIAVAQYLSYYALTYFPWYVRHTFQGDEAYKCWENYSVFSVSLFQYIIMAVVFSHGAPYRRSVITNKQLMISVFIMTGLSLYIAVWPAQKIADFMEIQLPEDVLLSYIIVIVAVANFIIALVFERVVIQYLMTEREFIPKFLKEKRVRKTPYLLIRRQLSDSDYLYGESSMRSENEVLSDSSGGKGP